MKMDKATRVWNMVMPNATNGHWYFSFNVEFEQISTQRVVVRWTDLAIGRGHFTLGTFGVCWGCLFESFKRLERIAEAHVEAWNELDAVCR